MGLISGAMGSRGLPTPEVEPISCTRCTGTFSGERVLSLMMTHKGIISITRISSFHKLKKMEKRGWPGHPGTGRRGQSFHTPHEPSSGAREPGPGLPTPGSE